MTLLIEGQSDLNPPKQLAALRTIRHLFAFYKFFGERAG